MEKPKDCIMVIFGASGDLTKRKLIPALFELYKQNVLPDKFAILGVSRTEMSDDLFREKMNQAIKQCKEDVKPEILDGFLKKLFYIPFNPNSEVDYEKLRSGIESISKKYDIIKNCIYYLATPPKMFVVIAENLGKKNMQDQSDGYKSLIVEKPFGSDLESARNLNKELRQVFKEEQIYRIDHYLGKETVQNVFVTRFSNGIFEPLWNRNFVSHIEVTAAENLGIENRGGYYDNAGALRDMVQNHLLQLVRLIAMEPPSSLDSNAIRNESLKVLQSLRPIKENDVEKYVIRGQYTASKIGGEDVKGYREEKNVNPESKTETYVALKFYIDNWRWGGVPFYIRTGKQLPTNVTEFAINFKPTPHSIFIKDGDNPGCNQLIIRIQPDEGVLLKFDMKVPGAGYSLQNINLDFHYKQFTAVHIPLAYERLIHDCMIGDSTLYSRGDVVEAAWEFVSPIQKAWQNNPEIKLFGYPAGTWGPENADELIEGKNMGWRYPCRNLTNDGIYCEL